MPRRAAAWRTTGAGSATLPIASLMAPASNPLWLVEVGCVNTTITAVAMTLRRIVTSAGTAGTAQTPVYEEENVGAAIGNPVDTHTVAPTLVAGFLRAGAIGASIGSGVIWTFGGRGLFIPSGVTNGVCLIPWTGATGQICDVYFSWDS